MFYQNILTELSPYSARVSSLSFFGEHRHADIEIHYPLRGAIEVQLNKKSYTVKEGEVLLISPMVAHAFPTNLDTDKKVLTLIMGVSFLKKYFSCFSQAKEEMYIIDLSVGKGNQKRLAETLKEVALLCETQEETTDLLIRGDLCKICAYLMEHISSKGVSKQPLGKEIIKVAAIEKALEMIYYDYAAPLTVEMAAEATGYGKSNFCKIFKSITGDTFHSILNRQRVECACALLSESNLSVSDIAAQVGFEETKTFCRVFKAITSQTPGQYRRQKKARS